MKLYGTPNSTYTRRVRIALLEKGLAAEEVETDAEARARAEYREINPFGRIPALVDGRAVLYESTAIGEYLEARHPEPALVPSDPADRARVAMFVKLCDLEFTPRAVAIQRPKRFEPEEAWDLEGMTLARAGIARHLAFLHHQLGGRDYLVADRFTWADLAYVPFLHFHELLEVDLPPSVDAWWQRLARRESVKGTVPLR